MDFSDYLNQLKRIWPQKIFYYLREYFIINDFFYLLDDLGTEPVIEEIIKTIFIDIFISDYSDSLYVFKLLSNPKKLFLKHVNYFELDALLIYN